MVLHLSAKLFVPAEQIENDPLRAHPVVELAHPDLGRCSSSAHTGVEPQPGFVAQQRHVIQHLLNFGLAGGRAMTRHNDLEIHIEDGLQKHHPPGRISVVKKGRHVEKPVIPHPQRLVLRQVNEYVSPGMCRLDRQEFDHGTAVVVGRFPRNDRRRGNQSARGTVVERRADIAIGRIRRAACGTGRHLQVPVATVFGRDHLDSRPHERLSAVGVVAVMVGVGDPFERFVGDLPNPLDIGLGRSRPVQRIEHENAIVTDNETGVAEAAAVVRRPIALDIGIAVGADLPEFGSPTRRLAEVRVPGRWKCAWPLRRGQVASEHRSNPDSRARYSQRERFATADAARASILPLGHEILPACCFSNTMFFVLAVSFQGVLLRPGRNADRPRNQPQ